MSIVIGILNATPDSFFDGEKHPDLIDRSRRMMDDGADWIDIGGESTRPNSDFVSLQEELIEYYLFFEAISKEATQKKRFD